MSKIAPHESQGRGNMTWIVGYHKKTTNPWSVNWKFCSKDMKMIGDRHGGQFYDRIGHFFVIGTPLIWINPALSIFGLRMYSSQSGNNSTK